MFDTTLANACISLADKWLQQNGKGCSSDDIKGWDSQQICKLFHYHHPDISLCLTYFLEKGVFLKKIELSDQTLPRETLVSMDSLYHLTESRNSEIRFNWYSICIKLEYEPIFPHVVQFLKEQGRMKFVRPVSCNQVKFFFRLIHNSLVISGSVQEFKRKAISFGYFQRMERELSQYCAKNGMITSSDHSKYPFYSIQFLARQGFGAHCIIINKNPVEKLILKEK